MAALPVGSLVEYRVPGQPVFRALRIDSADPNANTAAVSGNGGVYSGTNWEQIGSWADSASDALLVAVYVPRVV